MKIALVGNPNCGKTTIFNALTGSKQKIGNWPGVTVEKKSGYFVHRNSKLEIIDLPGIYSFDDDISEDENIAKNYLLSEDANLIINIVDSSHFERNLFLTLTLLEMGVPVIVVLNMKDLAKTNGITINPDKLQAILKTPVVSINSTNNNDVLKLKDMVFSASSEKPRTTHKIKFRESIDKVLSKWEVKIDNYLSNKSSISSRWIALELLLEKKDPIPGKQISQIISVGEVNKEISNLKNEWEEEIDVLIAEDIYSQIRNYKSEVWEKTKFTPSFSDKFDNIVLSRWLGIPIFLGIMYLLFWVVQQFAGAFIDFFDILAETFFVTGFGNLLTSIHAPGWLTTILSDGVGTGVQTVATFLPLIFVLYFFLSILESSGYMARAAFVADRLMQKIGLPGKAFVPMLVGFGCTVPAILAIRTLENKRDRYMAIFMTPLMSCAARLPVYILFAAAFFPHSQGLIVFSLYLVGIILAMLTGLLLKNTLFKGTPSTFVMELPPYHMPKLGTLLKQTWVRTNVFLKRAGITIVVVMAILGSLNSFKVQSEIGNSNIPVEQTALEVIGKAITPIFEPMGIEKDNWPASVGILTGLFAKEAVIGTLSGVYKQLESTGPESEIEEAEFEWSLWGGIKEAFGTIPENVGSAFQGFKDIFGLSDVGGTPDEISETVNADVGLFKQLQDHFDKGPIQAYAYLLFILIYFPCIAVLGAIKKESGTLITILSVSYLTVLAWIIATLVYQISIGHQLIWIIVPILMFTGIYILFNKIKVDTK
ncbi:MAG: ferrous iron transport protein B [Caldisericia bacterium]|nr:ferrous iron transport protein B [Caldisericia bacterium]